ncbi:limonene-1,2-epoxide hydrolase family protein [Mycolicibacterium sp.]|uniref:limonene-1,2-epoxide hydrolase family protein n=1 Tax=Mycolicibacterium sp. TaxID=2320850 RepID=UPI001A1908BE|nr:limonene-1,2-epoxide hydrolase family protein [Mycolicibacterium sp.]MBJ7337785.1 nuclear transport factor 2 family protein [Mycolicibacterium sp.]
MTTDPRDPHTVVTEFCKLWSTPDVDEIASWFTEDGVYHNIPMPAAEGRENIREFLGVMLADFDGIDFQVHRQMSDGSVVMNERTDVMRRKSGGEIALPVTGVFEVRDGRIAAWRDYFDMATVTSALE